MLFKIEIKKIAMFQNLINIISGIVSEVKFNCSPQHIQITTNHSQPLAIFHVQLSKNWFSFYQCNKLCELGIDLIALNAIVKELNSMDILLISHKTNDNYVRITIRSNSMYQCLII